MSSRFHVPRRLRRRRSRRRRGLRWARVAGDATTSSRRSPVPRPWSELTGKGSPRPSDTNSQTIASRLSPSTLLTTNRTGGPARRITLAAARSSSVTPVVTSTTMRMTSASESARSACVLTFASSTSPPASHPPVSMTENGTPDHSAWSTFRSRVDAALLLDHGGAFTHDPVHQRRLPDVGPSGDHDCAHHAALNLGRHHEGPAPRGGPRPGGTRSRRGRVAAMRRPWAPLPPAGEDQPRSAHRGTGLR